jgi:hypothetical protein
MRRLILLSAAAFSVLGVAAAGAATSTLASVTSDPFTNATSQHHTAVEPDSFAFGSTIVEAAQVGRFYDGGASDIGWGTSTDKGATWTRGVLPGVTKFRGAGPYDRVSDPSVAYDARHGVWMIASLALRDTSGVTGPAVLVSRSTDAIHWSNPVTVTSTGDLDKDWIVCDNWSSSPYYGHCYAEWDDTGQGDLIRMSTSSNGGLTWGAAKTTSDSAHGLGGQPVVRPNGVVVVPADDDFESSVIWFKSANGGSSWSASQTIAQLDDHFVAGGLRAPALPSAEVDGSGRVFVVWQDCRFRSGCGANDIVMSKLGGSGWSPVARVPIDATGSGVDHFIPGIAVDPATSGSTAHLALTYYFYPSASCTSSTCKLEVGFVSSANGGSTWTAPKTLAGPMSISWLPSTSQGSMVGDYVSTSFARGLAFPFFSAASAPSGSTFNQTIKTTAAGL